MLSAALAILGIAYFVTTSLVALQLLREREQKPALRVFLLGLALCSPFMIAAFLHLPGHPASHWVLLCLGAGVPAVLLVPTGLARPPLNDTPGVKLDERDTAFSRIRLPDNPDQREEYYQLRPENRKVDEALAAQPGLLSPKGTMHHPLWAAGVSTALHHMFQMRAHVNGPVASDRLSITPEAATKFLKNWCEYLGAHSVGITELRDYHVYSHHGFGREYGRPVSLEHRYMIVFSLEMDRDMTRTAPQMPSYVESFRQYERAQSIGIQIAALCRQLGYPARAHVFVSSDIVLPLAARDAGLGEIGRMGLAMDPVLGPRIRLAAVTIDLPLVLDTRRDGAPMLDFCTYCEKCADVCPAKAIPKGPRREHEGAWRWKLDQEACFRFWCATGSSCGRCMAVCPHGHPDSFMHSVVRGIVNRSFVGRRIAYHLDDLIFGRSPAPLPSPDWADLPRNDLPSRESGSDTQSNS